MTLPDRDAVKALFERGWLTGAESEVLANYLDLDDSLLIARSYQHGGDEGGDPDADDAASSNPYAYLVHRVGQILQNHQ